MLGVWAMSTLTPSGVDNYTDEATRRIGEVLSNVAAEDRLKAAQRLAELGVWVRGSTQPRGTTERSAACSFPDPTQEQALIACMRAIDGEVRRQIISVLGQWGGETSASAIQDV